MRVIGVVGLPASGKGEFSRIAGEMGIPVVVMGDIIRQAVVEAALPLSDLNMGEVSRGLREREGMDAIARRCIPVIEATGAPVVLVDGIRGDAEVDAFRRHFANFILIGIESAFETRLRRLSERGRPDDLLDGEELLLRDRREVSWGLELALSMADFIIENNGTLEAFTDTVRELLTRLRGMT
jgi:dephospho-CoA kinase